jgi:hypothetical protein
MLEGQYTAGQSQLYFEPGNSRKRSVLHIFLFSIPRFSLEHDSTFHFIRQKTFAITPIECFE